MFKICIKNLEGHKEEFFFNNVDSLADFIGKDMGFRMLSLHVGELFENAVSGFKKDFPDLGMTIECLTSDTIMCPDDFNFTEATDNGCFVKIEELNTMIECGAIVVDKGKLAQYKRNTRLATTNG